MDRQLWDRFRMLVAQGRKQYLITIADMCDVPRRKPSATDLYAERVGIQKKSQNRLLNAGYDTTDKLCKLIENALARSTTAWKAHAILFMLCNCRKALAWRRKHLPKQDRWLTDFFEYLKLLPSASGFDVQPQSRDGAIAFIHPGGAKSLAEDLLTALRRKNLVKKSDEDAVVSTLSTALRGNCESYIESTVHWIRSSRTFLNVVVREGKRRVPEGIHIHVKQIIVEPRGLFDSPRSLRKGERAPSHDEYMHGIMLYAIASTQKEGSRRPFVFEQHLVPIP